MLNACNLLRSAPWKSEAYSHLNTRLFGAGIFIFNISCACFRESFLVEILCVRKALRASGQLTEGVFLVSVNPSTV